MDKNISDILNMGGYVELTAPLLTFFPLEVESQMLAVIYLEPGTQIKIEAKEKNKIMARVTRLEQAHVVGDFEGTELGPIVDELMEHIKERTFFTCDRDLLNAIYVPVKDRHHE